MAEQQLFPVRIADLTAWGFAVPTELPWGGAQRLGIHQLPAGRRVIDSMGPDDHDITWKGSFIQRGQGDPDPVETARYIDYLRKQGAPVTLQWDVFEYLVLIEQFKPSYEYQTRVPFEMVLKVVEDKTAPVTSFSGPGVDEMVDDDFSNVLSLAPSLNMTVPAGLPGPFSNTVGAGPFNSAASASITWQGGVISDTPTNGTVQHDGTQIPMFNTAAEAQQFVADHLDAQWYSADYASTGAVDPEAKNPDGSAIQTFATQDQAQAFILGHGNGYAADYLP